MKKPPDSSLPFGDGPQRRFLDMPLSLFELAAAKVLRRNPRNTPWWRRYARSWQSFESTLAPMPDAPDAPNAESDIVLYGLTQVWNEADVIYATVRNLFLEGVDEVFMIDDASDDDSVTEAKAAGATVVHDDSDGIFLERRRTERLGRLIDERTEAAGKPVWWIICDADEFPRGPDGMTIRDFVRRLPPNVDTIGSRVLEHYPDGSSKPLPRHHPIDELPMARWHNHPGCPAGHWKHQILRVRRPDELRFMPGRHTIAAPPDRKPVIESTRSLLMHHFPLRDKEWTERKLRLSGASSGRYTRSRDSFLIDRVGRRLRMLELAYQERYDAVPNLFPGEPLFGVSVHDWRDLVPPDERTVRHEAGVPL